VRDVTGIMSGLDIDHDIETIVEADIAGPGLGTTKKALVTAVTCKPRVGGDI
jgi:hypothetical protein